MRWLRITAYGDRDAVLTTVDAAVLIVRDATEEVVARRALETSAKQHEETLGRLTARVDELTSRQRVLLQANDELTVANGELRSVNEQLLINAEEAASANEEIETLNEEMQATNEELETLNEELQATVEELNTTNDELEARGHELERMAQAREAQMLRLENERRALTALLHGVPGSVVVVGNGSDVLFASDALGEWLARAPDRWWEKGDSAVVDGRTLSYTVQDETVESQPFRVIRFRAEA